MPRQQFAYLQLRIHSRFVSNRPPNPEQAILLSDGKLRQGIGSGGVVIQINDCLIESNVVIPPSPFPILLYCAKLGGLLHGLQII